MSLGSSPTPKPCSASPAPCSSGPTTKWQVTTDRRYLSESSMALLNVKTDEEVAKPELMTA